MTYQPSSTKRLFITATGTEIGKTYIAEQLCRSLVEQGETITVSKPIISGYEDGQENDTERLLKAANKELTKENIHATSPWRLNAPLSPDMAARLENRSIPFEELIHYCHQAVSTSWHIIEGVGGVMVPIDTTHTVLDWIQAYNASTILVTGNYLGSISHTLTAYQALTARQINVALVLINQKEPSEVPMEQTVETLNYFIDCPVMISEEQWVDRVK